MKDYDSNNFSESDADITPTGGKFNLADDLDSSKRESICVHRFYRAILRSKGDWKPVPFDDEARPKRLHELAVSGVFGSIGSLEMEESEEIEFYIEHGRLMPKENPIYPLEVLEAYHGENVAWTREARKELAYYREHGEPRPPEPGRKNLLTLEQLKVVDIENDFVGFDRYFTDGRPWSVYEDEG